ncbi:MAG: hypothetical protein JXA52_08665 [Planctomycetes bacterium]|nr:hypothetical protein [Planctomycetota bacterium]
MMPSNQGFLIRVSPSVLSIINPENKIEIKNLLAQDYLTMAEAMEKFGELLSNANISFVAHEGNGLPVFTNFKDGELGRIV